MRRAQSQGDIGGQWTARLALQGAQGKECTEGVTQGTGWEGLGGREVIGSTWREGDITPRSHARSCVPECKRVHRKKRREYRVGSPSLMGSSTMQSSPPCLYPSVFGQAIPLPILSVNPGHLPESAHTPLACVDNPPADLCTAWDVTTASPARWACCSLCCSPDPQEGLSVVLGQPQRPHGLHSAGHMTGMSRQL